MLLELHISNFAIIEDCHLSFRDGLVALTGETGAGKSIIVDALSAVLGSRTGADSVRSGSERAEVEAVFDAGTITDTVESILERQGIEGDGDILVLRREIHAGGRRHRADQRPDAAYIGAIRNRSTAHRHARPEQHLSLLLRVRQLDMLDHFGQLDNMRDAFAAKAADVTRLRQLLEELRAGQRGEQQRLDLLRFQIQEIDQAELQLGEEEALGLERSRLANAEKLAGLSESVFARLEGSEDQPGAAPQLTDVARILAELANIDNELRPTEQLATDLQFQVQDLASSVRQYRNAIEFDPVRLDDIESRMSEIARLKRKYGDAIDGVLAFGLQAQTDLASIEHYDLRVLELEVEVREAEASAGAAAGALSGARRLAAGEFTQAVLKRLDQLGLAGSRFEIALDHTASDRGLPVETEHDVNLYSFSLTGIDQVAFRVSFNAGEELKPIERVASGERRLDSCLASRLCWRQTTTSPRSYSTRSTRVWAGAAVKSSARCCASWVRATRSSPLRTFRKSPHRRSNISKC